MKSDAKIRLAVPEDIGIVKEIEDESFSRPWTSESFAAEIEKDWSYFYVYELDGILLGYVIMYKVIDEAEVATIAVSNNHRGKGIGRELLNYAIKSVKPITTVYLEVEQTNASAVSLYRDMGFYDTGVIKDYYGKDRHAFRMTLEI